MKDCNKDKIILHLYGFPGSDSIFYVQNGYDVRRIAKQYGYDVRTYTPPPKNVYGIIANPDCRDLAGSGARYWEAKGEKALLNALSMVDAVYRIVAITNPKFWLLENPVGRLTKYIGKPVMYTQPYEYGAPYTKKTCWWGKFNKPKKNIVVPIEGSKMHKLPPSSDRAILRSITPIEVAKAFYEANK